MTEYKRKKHIVFLCQVAVIAVLCFIDQITKIKAENVFINGDLTLIKNILSFTYVENTGAAFGSFSDSTFVLGIVTAVALVIGLVCLFTGKINGKIPSVCAVMIIAGGTGNVIDRFVRNYVIDFIRADFINFPVFNFADILVTCGVFIAIGYLIYDAIRDVKKVQNGETDG